VGVGGGGGGMCSFFIRRPWDALSQKKRPKSKVGLGRSSLLIMSVTQTGLIACKVSGGERRYERTMDQSNVADYRLRVTEKTKASPSLA
jgi:hypothetical protein